MKAKPVYLDFLNREASRAGGRERAQKVDLDILRTLCIALPYGFSSNISQMTEYANERSDLFETILKLIGARIIDATSSAATMDEFIEDRQQRYSHVADRYQFYFARAPELQKVRLGTRNEFSMTRTLGQHLLNYESSRFPFDLVRASSHDQAVFESGHDALVKKLMARENLAITRDLLETNRRGESMSPQQIAASSRIFSALYMKIYAEQRNLATCTGIPDFSYKEVLSDFPSFDYPILRRAIVSLGGERLLVSAPIDEIIAGYATKEHQHFAYYLEGYLEAVSASIKARANDPSALNSLRALFDQFFVRELDDDLRTTVSHEVQEFFHHATIRLLASADRLSKRDPVFRLKWREYVPEPTKGLIVITTATDSEDKALFSALEKHGFKRSKVLMAGQNVAQEYLLSLSHRLVHVRTRAGSLGVNSAGGVLAPVLNELKATFVISAGICFGLKPKKYEVGKQEFGDVLIASEIQDYETNRLGSEILLRGEKLPAGPGLLSAARIAKDQTDLSDFSVFEGTVLSGQKLVDDRSFVEQLRDRFPEALGGEMEGNALATAAIYEGRQWILIKAICDWGMEKEDGSQNLAAERACQLAVKTAKILMTSE